MNMVMKAASLAVSIMIVFISSILLVGVLVTTLYSKTEATLQSSPEGKMALIANDIATYVSFLSSMDSGSIIKDLNDTYDINIERYGAIKKFLSSLGLKTIGNYYVQLKYYGTGDKISGDKVPIIGDVKVDQTTGKLALPDVRVIMLKKVPGGLVEISGFSSFSQAGGCIPDAHSGVLFEVLGASELQNLIPGAANLVAAIIEQESNWNKNAYRYEPNYDYKLQEDGKLKNYDQKYVMTAANGMTIEEWFRQNPARSGEKEAGRDYTKYIAQTRISASYGLMQTLYTTAVEMKYTGQPEGLYDPKASIEYGVKYLEYLVKMIQDKQYAYIDDKNLIRLVSGSYNGGPGVVINNCVPGGSGGTYPCTWDVLEKRVNSRIVSYVKNVNGYYEQFMFC
jgi:hypothetical protein